MHVRMSTGTLAICCASAAPCRYGWGERRHVGGRRLPRLQVPLAKPTFDLCIPYHDKAPWLPVAPVGCTDGGMQHGLNRLVGHGLLAEVAYRPLAVDDVEKRYIFVCHGGTPPPTFSLTKHRHREKRIVRVTGFYTSEKTFSRQQWPHLEHYICSQYYITNVVLNSSEHPVFHGCQQFSGIYRFLKHSKLLMA